MTINSDINILGSLQDWNLVNVFLRKSMGSLPNNEGMQSFTAIKTDKSVKRFERAITGTLIKFKNPEIETLVRNVFNAEQITVDSLLLLFWNASCNNNLLHYLNHKVFFPAFYSGRVTIKNDEIIACLNELKASENDLKEWSASTIHETASKYLTLLRKFGLMEGSVNKTILHPYLNDKMFVIFIYWLLSVEPAGNLMQSGWLSYSFSEKQVFLQRLLQKKHARYFDIYLTSDNLKIELLTPYQDIYNAITKS